MGIIKNLTSLSALGLIVVAIAVILTVGGLCCCCSSLSATNSTSTTDKDSYYTSTLTPKSSVTPVPTTTSQANPTPGLTLSLKGNYTDNPNYDKSGTAENTLIQYLDAIYCHDYKRILDLRLPSWVKSQNQRYEKLGIEDIKPDRMIYTMYEDVYLEGYDVKAIVPKGNNKQEAHVNVYMRYPTTKSELWYTKVTVTLEKENGKYYVSDYYPDTYSKPWQ